MFPLACVDGSEILLGLAVVAVIPIILIYIAAQIGIHVLAASAQGECAGRPVSLFLAALSVPLVMTLVALARFTEEVTIGIGAAGLFFAILFGWNFLRKREPAVPLAHRVPGTVWLQDLLIAVLCYGAQLALFLPHVSHNFDTFVYFAAFNGVAFSIAADVASRSALGQRPLCRAGLFAAMLAFSPLTFIGMLLAWYMWRAALKRVQKSRTTKAVLN